MTTEETTIESGEATSHESALEGAGHAPPENSTEPRQSPVDERLTPEKIASYSKSKTKAPKKEEVPPPSETPPPAAYTPNFKFVASDAEHEIPEFVRGVIKDADTEKKIKEIFEKAYGLDTVKARMAEFKTEHSQLKRNFNDLIGGIQELRELYQGGDLDGFFDRLKIPVDRILQYALDKVTYNELPPEQRKVLDERLAAQRQTRELEKQNQAQIQDSFDSITRAKGLLLDASLARPDIQSIARAFESSPGRKPGDFRRAVCEHGEYVWFKSNGQMDLTPEEAISQVMSRYGLTPAIAQGGTQPLQANANPNVAQSNGTLNSVPKPPNQVPVIPNVAGRTSSPLKEKPKSIDDLKKLARQMSS